MKKLTWPEVYAEAQQVKKPTIARHFAVRWLAQIGEGALTTDPQKTVDSLIKAIRDAMSTAKEQGSASTARPAKPPEEREPVDVALNRATAPLLAKLKKGSK